MSLYVSRIFTWMMSSLVFIGLTGMISGMHSAYLPLVSATSSCVQWYTNHETGSFSDWELNQGTAIYNSNTPPGSAEASISTDYSRSGHYSLQLSLTGAQNHSPQGARVFRTWLDGEHIPYTALPDGYYAAYYYFPEVTTPLEWWIIFEFKDWSTTTGSLPTLTVNVENDDGNMSLYVWDQLNQVAYDQEHALTLPVQEWVQIGMYIKQSTNTDGAFELWQDDQLLVKRTGIRTLHTPASRLHWAVANYTNDIVPSNPIIYIDDAVISKSRIRSWSQADSAEPVCS